MTHPTDVSLTQRQRQLLAAVTARTAETGSRLQLLTPLARTVGASERDVQAVREVLVAPHVL